MFECWQGVKCHYGGRCLWEERELPSPPYQVRGRLQPSPKMGKGVRGERQAGEIASRNCVMW